MQSPRNFSLGLFLNDHFIFYYYLLSLLAFGCTGSSLLCVDFLQLWRAGATLCCNVLASVAGASLDTGPVAVAHGCLVARRHRTLPRPGSGPVSVALAGRFLTTGPLGKPWKQLSWYPFCFLLSSYTEHLICFEHPGEIFPALLASITAILLMSIF